MRLRVSSAMHYCYSGNSNVQFPGISQEYPRISSVQFPGIYQAYPGYFRSILHMHFDYIMLQRQQVNEYMSYRNLPKVLRHKITNYYDHKFGGKMFNEQAILAELSHTLRAVGIFNLS